MSSRPSDAESGHILALHPDVHPEKYILGPDVCTIGRSPKCEIIVQRTIVSRLHAKIEPHGSRYLLSDANSANGTFVNTRRIREAHLLEDGDQIGLGTQESLLRFNDPDATERIRSRLEYVEYTATFFLEQQPLDLTPSEFDLLHHLFRHAGEVCNRASCYRAIRDQEYDSERDKGMLDGVVSNLRGKLRQIDPTAAKMIETRRRQGYVLNL